MMDPILFWNDVALEANRVDHTDADKKEQAGPTLSSRALAIVHLAMYDAYAGVINDPPTLPPYLSGLPAPLPGHRRTPRSPRPHMRRYRSCSQAKSPFSTKSTWKRASPVLAPA
jgi:hypothetical protein